jgi:cell division protein FtsN
MKSATTFLTPEEAALELELPLLGIVPRPEKASSAVCAVFPEGERSRREYHRVADRILLSPHSRSGAVGFVGDVSSSLRAVVVAHLSATLAAEKTSILIDADLRGAHLSFDDRGRAQEGLVDVLRYGVRSPRVVAPTQAPGLNLLPVGSGTVDYEGTYHSEAIPSLFAELRRSGDLLVVNGPAWEDLAHAGRFLRSIGAWILVHDMGASRADNTRGLVGRLGRESCLGILVISADTESALAAATPPRRERASRRDEASPMAPDATPHEEIEIVRGMAPVAEPVASSPEPIVADSWTPGGDPSSAETVDTFDRFASSLEEPAQDEPAGDERAHDEPARDEPVREEPVREEPVREEPPRDEPVRDEPPRDERRPVSSATWAQPTMPPREPTPPSSEVESEPGIEPEPPRPELEPWESLREPQPTRSSDPQPVASFPEEPESDVDEDAWSEPRRSSRSSRGRGVWIGVALLAVAIVGAVWLRFRDDAGDVATVSPRETAPSASSNRRAGDVVDEGPAAAAREGAPASPIDVMVPPRDAEVGAEDSRPSPSTVQPEATQPPATQPPATQPPATQPSASEPETTQPLVAQPQATQPQATQPPTSQPKTAGSQPAEGKTVDSKAAPAQPPAKAALETPPPPRVTRPAAATSGPGFAVHVSSVKSKSGADEEAATIAATGVPVFVREVDLETKGRWYRIYIGPYADKETARREEAELRATGKYDYTQVQRVPAGIANAGSRESR